MRSLIPTVQPVTALGTGLPQDYDIFERHLFENVQQAPFHSSFDPECILLPTRGCSMKFVDHDKTWNSWVHYAVQYPDFDQEHDLFWEKLETGTPIEDIDPSWLGLYFAVLTVSNYASSFRDGVLKPFLQAALLTMDEEEAMSLSLPISNHSRAHTGMSLADNHR